MPGVDPFFSKTTPVEKPVKALDYGPNVWTIPIGIVKQFVECA
jgi:hypothetical protein